MYPNRVNRMEMIIPNDDGISQNPFGAFVVSFSHIDGNADIGSDGDEHSEGQR